MTNGVSVGCCDWTLLGADDDGESDIVGIKSNGENDNNN